MKPTETVEGMEQRFDAEFPMLNQATSFTSDRVKRFIQSELDLALTKERTRVNKVLEGLKNNTKAMSKTNEKAVEQTKGYLQALSDAQKRITEKEVATAYKNPTISTEIG